VFSRNFNRVFLYEDEVGAERGWGEGTTSDDGEYYEKRVEVVWTTWSLDVLCESFFVKVVTLRFMCFLAFLRKVVGREVVKHQK